LREKEKTRVFSKDSRAKKTAKKIAKWKEKLLEKAFF
jgi:hypothetical protein